MSGEGRADQMVRKGDMGRGPLEEEKKEGAIGLTYRIRQV